MSDVGRLNDDLAARTWIDYCGAGLNFVKIHTRMSARIMTERLFLMSHAAVGGATHSQGSRMNARIVKITENLISFARLIDQVPTSNAHRTSV